MYLFASRLQCRCVCVASKGDDFVTPARGSRDARGDDCVTPAAAARLRCPRTLRTPPPALSAPQPAPAHSKRSNKGRRHAASLFDYQLPRGENASRSMIDRPPLDPL
eukprot:1327474-Pyramimonas_sp.AAC.1